MDESFGSADFIEKRVSRQQHVYKGYPALDGKYRHKDGSMLSTRFIVKGPHYYTLIAHGKNNNAAVERFFNSFEFIPFVYNEIKQRKDTAMYFSVAISWFPEEKENKIELPDENGYVTDDDDDDSFYEVKR
jgi:hypothetical protein